jgi:hypothetical protein
VRLLMQRRGDITFETLLKRLRCKRCGKSKPAPVYLVAGHHRTAGNGPTADWAVELVPPPVKRYRVNDRAYCFSDFTYSANCLLAFSVASDSFLVVCTDFTQGC